MKKIVIGLVFILFNFNVTFGTATINLIPTFIGYFLIINVCVRLANQTSNNLYLETRKYASILFVISLFIFVLELIGLGAANPIFSISISILYLVLSLVFLHRLTQSITTTIQFDLPEAWIQKIHSLFMWIAILTVLGFIFLITPVIAFVFVIIAIVFNVRYILMLSSLNQSLDPQYL